MTARFLLYSLLFIVQICTLNNSKAQIVINEIMSNPNNGRLPNYEYIELFNSSRIPIQLSEFTFGYNNNRVSLPEYLLAPQQYVILCNQEALPAFERYGNVLALSRWYILANTGATLQIFRNSTLIDAVSYRNTWHRNTSKRNGGWSLERINPNWTCNLRENWASSEALNGGTPGRRNSIVDRNSRPQILLTHSSITANKINLTFNTSSFNHQQITVDDFEINNGIGKPTSIQWNESLDTLTLLFVKDFEENKIYILMTKPIEICSFFVKIPNEKLFKQTTVNHQDIIISEILFNPKEGGVDFVEVYNVTNLPINLKNWKIGNRTISEDILLIDPDEYLALTINKAILSLHYPSAIANNILQLASLPPYPNQQGNVMLFSANNLLIDSVYYNANMHAPILRNVKGISLERQSTNRFDLQFNTFSSASTLHEGATPGYKNSTSVDNMLKKNKIFFTSKTVSPNNDFYEDFLEINYQFNDADYYINITIYNDKGTLINRLIRNQRAGSTGIIEWNTLHENGKKATAGHYIMIAEIYNNKGQKERFKKAFVIVSDILSY